MLVYIDQNILSLQTQSNHALELPEATFVYSDAHLGEIGRSNRPASYLDALERIGARYLIFETRNGVTTDNFLLSEDSPRSIFESYQHRVSSSPLRADPFLAASAWINGGANRHDVELLARGVAGSIKAYSANLPPVIQKLTQVFVDELESKLGQMANQIIVHGNDVETWRKSIDGRNGSFGDIHGSHSLLQIWDRVKEQVGYETPEQFFGFEPLERLGSASISRYLAIVACCGVLDVVGFQAEKKRRKVDKQPNVQSDAQHIASASYCDVIFSCDKRLIRRAQAIYEFRSIQTNAVYLPISNGESE